MLASRSFPPLKESDIRRLVGAATFKKACRLWDCDAVVGPVVGAEDATLFASVRDVKSLCQVAVQHLAGHEFVSRCDCDDASLCAHAVALLLAWSSADYAFGRAEMTPEPLEPGIQLKEQWQEYLQEASLAHLRAVARRHQIAMSSGERSAILERVIDTLCTPQAQRFAIANLNEAQRRVLEMVYLLSDGQPDTNAQDVQDALGWSNQADVESVLRELSEWGLVVSVSSRWRHSDAFTIAPDSGPLVAQLDSQRCEDEQFFAQPRNVCVEPFTGDLSATRVEAQARTVPELLLIARHLPLRLRPPQPELAQSRTIRALRQWTYDIDELVQLQVLPGWQHQSESVLSVPAPEPRLDDASLAGLRSLTDEEALGDFVAQLLPPVAPDVLRSSDPSGLQQSFDLWLYLAGWTELWLAQRRHGLLVRRTLVGPQVAYPEWLNKLARARRFVVRVLSGLDVGQWYDFRSFLHFIHAIHPDFLRDERGGPGPAPSWWLEHDGAPVKVYDFDAWCASYGHYVEAVLYGPLRWFGAAQVALSPDDNLLAFRLTPLGHALLQRRPYFPSLEDDAPLEVADNLRARLPIGRSDLSPYRILDQIARFEDASDGCVSYRFDAERAHAAFESGFNADDVLQQLERLARGPLPSSARAQWLAWWSSYARLRWYDGLTLVEFADDYVLQELLAQTDLNDHILFTFGARLVALRPESADSVARQLVKKGYMPKMA